MTYKRDIKSASTSIGKAQADFTPNKKYGPNQTAAIRSSLELVATIMELRMEDGI